VQRHEGTSRGDQRGATQPDIGAQLIQDELGNVLSRYASAMEIGEILECLDRAATRLVVQDGGANENPGKTALLDDRFLPIIVGVDLPQEKREDHVIEEETTMPGAVAGTYSRDADQAGDVLGLHGLYQRPRRGRQKCHFLEGAGRRAQRADDGVAALDGLAQLRFVASVADDEP
jgi:hypothetical protein